MEVTINAVSDVEHEARFVVPDVELQPHFEQAYKRYAPKIEVKGFRKGKVPLHMVKQLYGEAIEHETLDDIATDTFRSAMLERHIQPVGNPSITMRDFKRGEQFTFTVAYEVKPTFVLKPYKGIAVEKPVYAVTDSDVEGEIQRLQRANAELLGVTLVRDKGDHVITADVQELAEDGMPLIGKKTKDAKFSLADEALVKEIREALATAEVGGEYKVRFEQQHGDHTHAHHIAIAVKKIEKVELPDFDDAFVKKITQDDTLTAEAFRTRLRKDMEVYWAEQAERRVVEAIIDQIVKAHDMEVPPSLVNSYLDSFVEDVKNRSRDQQLPRGFDETKFRTESRDHAVFQAKWRLIREQIIEKEGLTVSDDEVEQLAAVEAASIGIEKDQLLKYYRNSNAASDRILSNKVMRMLREHAVVTERVVPPEG